MGRHLWLFGVLPWSAGCVFHCGDYTLAGTGMQFEGTEVDGDFFESCGTMQGSWGSWDLYDDGRALVNFNTSAANEDRDWLAPNIDMEVDFTIADMEVGKVFPFEELGGGAYLTDASGNIYDPAGLTAGSVEIIAKKFDGDACSVDTTSPPYGPVYIIKWTDLAWTDGSGLSYAANGQDKISFDTTFAPECGWNVGY